MPASPGFIFSRSQIDEALALLGLPGMDDPNCPLCEEPVSLLDGGRSGETALTVVAEDFREAVALAMQLAALVCDPEEVADLHTRMVFSMDGRGRLRYQYRGYHVADQMGAVASGPLPAA